MAYARERESSLRELAVANASQDLFAVVKDVRELYLLGSISHPLFCALASRANKVLAKIYGRRWDGEKEGETVEQQRRWIEENSFRILDKRKRHRARSAVPIDKEQKQLVKKVYGEISRLRVESQDGGA